MGIPMRSIVRTVIIVGVCAALVALGVGAAPSASAASGIAYVQGSAFGTGTKVTSTTVTLAQPVGAGDLLVGWFSQYKVAGNVGVSDNVNGAWTRSPAALPFGSSGDNAMYYRPGSAASASGLTITVTAPSAAYLQGTVAEYSGVATSSPLDSVAVGSGVSVNVQTAQTVAVSAGDLVYSALVTGSSAGGDTPGSSGGVPYTARAAISSGSAYEQDITSAAAGPQVGAATLAKSADWYAVVAAFRPATTVTPVPPSAPSGVSLVGVSSSQVQLSWTAATDNVPVTGYTVYRDGVQVGTATATGFTDGTVAASTTYVYAVSASNGAGQEGPQSASLSVTTAGVAPVPPSAPSGVSLVGVSSSQVQLSWTAATDNVPVTGYTVYRDGVQVGTATATGFTDGTVAASTTYVYAVSASNGAGQEGPQSASLSVTTAGVAPVPPSAPSGVSLVGVSSSQVQLSWTAATDNVPVTGYTVYRDGVQVGTATATGFTDGTVAASTTYVYAVSASNGAGQEGPQSASLSVTTAGVAPVPPSAPSGVSLVGVSSSQVQLSWTAATDNVPVTGYTVYRDGVQVGTATATGFTDGTVAASTTYVYAVSASNGAGQEGPQSASLSVTTAGSGGPCSVTDLVSAIVSANSQSGGGTVTLQSGCDFVLTSANNTAQGGNGLPVITGDVTIQGNGATIERSAASGTPHFRIFDVATGATLTIHNLTLSNGIADNGSDGGGAIWNHGTLSVTGSTFTKNSNPATSGTSGGAIQNSGTATVTGCTFTDNSAMEGGAVFNQSSFLIRQSTFTNNAATVYGGGAILNAYGTTTVDGSTFVGNSGPGGGVVDNDTTINISNSTMYNNIAGSHGGGAIQNFGVVNLTTSTLSGNSSPYGANIYNYLLSAVRVSSTIVAAGVGGSNCGGGAITDGGNNLDSGSSCTFRAAHTR